MKIVLCSGGFSPCHSGHIAYFKAARALGDKLIVGLNSDEWLERKKGHAFMPWNERLCVINNLAMVDEVYTFDDSDGSACHFIEQVRAHYPNDHIIFANGGDRNAENIPEMRINDVEFVFGVGGTNKKNSSSWILRDWKQPKTSRPWGEYRVLYDHPTVGSATKVKEMLIEPNKKLSLQRHQHRREYWFVVEGRCDVYTTLPSGYSVPTRTLNLHDTMEIHVGEWHQLTNPYSGPCKLIEIQFGAKCEETDIERNST